jgi:serine/threonine protein kinase
MLESSGAGNSNKPSTQSPTSEDSSANEMSPGSAPSPNSELIAQVICDVIASRSRGERVSYEQVIASHPELMPGLREELLALDAIHQTVIISRIKNSDTVPNDPDPSKGLRIDGYSIEREISSGGQATVFKAVKERTGRVVAVKIMHGGPFMGSRGRKRFERESKIMAEVNHPNIVGILDKGRTADGSFYLVMDFVEGCSLDVFVKQLGKDAAGIVKLFVKVTSAVNEAHRLGIVHRDLKPMNILVDHRGEPHVLDFGMARVLDGGDGVSEGEPEQVSLTRTGQVLGSLPWTSPEQIFGSPDTVGARSDVYALGVMLFVSLAGEFPYPVQGGPKAITRHVANTPPGSLRRLAQRNGVVVDHSLEEIVLKTLRKTPSSRYESAGQLADDLQAWLDGKPIQVGRRVSFAKLGLLILIFAAFLVPRFVLGPYWFNSTSATGSGPTIKNSVGMFFVKIAPGAVLMDAPADIRDVELFKAQSFRVDRAFYFSATVVTQEEYWKVTGRKPIDPSEKDPDLPIQRIKWDEAVAFCDALSKQDKRKYRLPTPAEWRYAFERGTSGSLTPSQIERMAWCAENSGLQLQRVAQKSPDGSGLYDMLGNVRQWCSDAPSVPSDSPSSIKQSGRSFHIAAGTDFLTPASECVPPAKLETEYKPDTSAPTIGFRVVCESP